MADNAIMVFDGSPTTVITTTSIVADGNFTVAADNATLTEFDNSSDLWPLAVATLSIPDTFSKAPADQSTIDLYMFKQDVDGSLDETAPSITDSEGAHYVGSFVLADTDANQPKQIIFSLAGVRKCKFAFQNNASAVISYSAGNTVKVEGFTYTPST